MARPSPGTQRVIAILNFLANSPGKAFSLTELIEGLKMNRSTCHSLANELVNEGYLYRTRDKLYVLGPAAAQLGRAADLHASPLQIALPEMTAIANRYDVICSAIFRDGPDVLIRESAISVSHLGWQSNRKSRWPLRPPFGAVFLAGSSDRDVEAWFEALSPAPSPEECQRTREGLVFLREQGFQFVIRQMPPDDRDESMAWIYVADPANRPLEIGTSIESEQSYQITSMSSPVYERGGKVAFTIGLTGFSRACLGSEIRDMGGELRSACERVTHFSRDVRPERVRVPQA